VADLLARLTAHFREKAKRVRRIEIPELADEDGRPAEIYVWPATLDEMNRIRRRGGPCGGDLAVLAETLIVRARNHDRSPYFSTAQRSIFMRETDPALVSKIAGLISDDLAGDEELRDDDGEELDRPN